MRTPFAILFLVTLLIAGTYWYGSVEAVCKVPISYRIGTLDSQFDLTQDEARVAVSEAESVWENATGENLFTYDPDATFAINFIFDERQAFSEAEKRFRESLDASADVNDVISEQYAELVAEYSSLHAHYEDLSETFERKLSVYNQKVASYNEDGGAPKEVYEELNREKESLDAEAKSINTLSKQLNGLVDEINTLSEKGNELVQSYNEEVGTYNDTFGSSREFTQGDYKGDSINIYTFDDTGELTLVLVHEFGHALSLGHVEYEKAVLYHHLGEQATPTRLTEADLTEFERVCGATKRSFIERLLIRFRI